MTHLRNNTEWEKYRKPLCLKSTGSGFHSEPFSQCRLLLHRLSCQAGLTNAMPVTGLPLNKSLQLCISSCVGDMESDLVNACMAAPAHRSWSVLAGCHCCHGCNVVIYCHSCRPLHPWVLPFLGEAQHPPLFALCGTLVTASVSGIVFYISCFYYLKLLVSASALFSCVL